VDGLRGPGAWHSLPGPRPAGGLTPWQVPEGIELPCRREPDLYFAEDPNDLRQAKALCRTCAIRATCLAGALERGEPWGVWGGEMLEQGRIIADKRPRGRPRKTVIAA
jgi:WhiB family transcriptional regulator, redox-sensing transcriptional regulator